MECNQFIKRGLEPYEPEYKGTMGKYIYDKLVTLNSEEPAMIDGFTKETLSFNRILEEACNLAEALRRYGCDTNSVISISCQNNTKFFVPVLASLFAGTIMAPINPLYTFDELNHVLNISKPVIVFTSKNFASKFSKIQKEHPNIDRVVVIDADTVSDGTKTLKEFVDKQLHGQKVNPKDFQPFCGDARRQTAFILSSSGTTGLPKGVMITHKNITIRTSLARDPRFPNIYSTVLGLMPFFHCYGLNMGLASIAAKSTMIVLNKFDEDVFLKYVQDFKLPGLYIAPPLAVFLAKSPKLKNYDLSSLKELYCGAAPLSKELTNLLIKRLQLKSFKEAYGLTEAYLSVTIMERDVVKPGSVGRAIPHICLKVRDPETRKSLGPYKVGEICVKGEQVMKGYYKNEQATREAFTSDGWLLTGDLGYYDNDDYFFIVDRLKELIKYKGFQVAPAELESLLLTHPKILDAAAVGRPDETAGELPTAFIVPKSKDLTAKEVQGFVAEKVSPQKRLRGGVIFIDSIPKNPSGKILRRELRKIMSDNKKLVESKL